MVQGTTSHSGKSFLVTALCRIYSDMGYKVAPFKSQNMSLNSSVTQDGFEIARSQFTQSLAARIRPMVEFNPILLKPKGNKISQIILMGKPYADTNPNLYYPHFIPKLIPVVKKAFNKLKEEFDIIIIEGAGSPAEINLMDKDIANMYIAKLDNSPVLLIADIDRGGIFASIYGTINLLKQEEQNLIKFYVINKFRGEIKLLENGIDKINRLVGKKCLGVIPYLDNLNIPSEDSLSLEDHISRGNLKIKVIRLPYISNFTDFESLHWEDEVDISYIKSPNELIDADVIIIPGTKNTIDDLKWMKENGFISKLKKLEELNYIIFGICGGYQILGKTIYDKTIEGTSENKYNGLGLLSIHTEFLSYDKTTRQVQAKVINLPFLKGNIISGYEIHMGEVIIETDAIPFLKLVKKENQKRNNILGVINNKGNVIGTFLHGLWDNDLFRHRFIDYILSKSKKKRSSSKRIIFNEIIEKNIQKIANQVEENIDINQIGKLLGIE
ncbi:MAG: cobyric acid synthase [Candidatus Lokiarchaeota archaeon]|nr:cobyric acid synthase [Candidatus Lokiarchaeota archaeon]